MAESQLRVQFHCPMCGGTAWTAEKGHILCMSEADGMGNVCDGKWKLVDAWKVFVLIRPFISKQDYDYYQEKTK